MSEKSDWETKYSLIDRVRDPKDNESWKEFIAYYEKYIRRIIVRIGAPASEVDEICQVIVVKLWESLPNFTYDKNRGKFRQWLSTVIKNETRKILIKTQRQGELKKEHNEHISNELLNTDANTGLDQMIEQEWKRNLSREAWNSIKNKFNEDTQNVFLRSMEGLTPKEISEKYNVRENTVNVYKKRVREFLEEEIKRQNEFYL